MSRVTSKLQVTIPRAIADEYGIAPGDEIDFAPAGDTIRVRPPRQRPERLDRARRLEEFDQATDRQRARQKTRRRSADRDRRWRRDDLYERGRAS